MYPEGFFINPEGTKLLSFKKDSMNGKFPGKKQSSYLEKKQFEEFLNQLD